MAKIITHLVLSLFRPLFNLQGTGSCSLCFAVRFERLNVLYYITLGFFCQALFFDFRKVFFDSIRCSTQSPCGRETRTHCIISQSVPFVKHFFHFQESFFSVRSGAQRSRQCVENAALPECLNMILQTLSFVNTLFRFFLIFFSWGNRTGTEAIPPSR